MIYQSRRPGAFRDQRRTLMPIERTPDERGWGLWLLIGAGVVIWACVWGAVL